MPSLTVPELFYYYGRHYDGTFHYHYDYRPEKVLVTQCTRVEVLAYVGQDKSYALCFDNMREGVLYHNSLIYFLEDLRYGFSRDLLWDEPVYPSPNLANPPSTERKQ